MKKFFIILSLFIISLSSKSALADDIGLDDYSSGIENAWYGQKPVTDESFEKTVTKLEEKKKGNKKKNFKGTSLNHVEKDNGNYMNELSDKTLLLGLPVELVTTDGQEIPVGHYNIVGKKVKNKVYLDFRQSNSIIATVEASESDSDFGESSISFVKLIPYDETKVKLIYGSIEFNASTFIKIKNELED